MKTFLLDFNWILTPILSHYMQLNPYYIVTNFSTLRSLKLYQVNSLVCLIFSYARYYIFGEQCVVGIKKYHGVIRMPMFFFRLHPIIAG